MKEKIAYLQDILEKGYNHYFQNSDGYCKSSEGYIEVSFSFPNYFEFKDNNKEKGKSDYCVIKVYSYCLGTSRMHEFEGDTFEEAYNKAKQEVEIWVKNTLE